MRKLQYLIFFVFAVLLWACNEGESHPVTDSAAKAPATHSNYVLGEATEAEIGSTVHLPAVLKPFEMVDIYPKVNGFVKEVPVDRGSRVRTGQLLIRLEAPEIEQQYMGAKARYLQAYALSLATKDDYDRLTVANKMPGTVSAHDLELARARMMADSATTQAEIANYKALEATRDYLTVTAPFDGVITERNVHPGALVGPNLKTDDRPMLVLQKEDRLRLVIDVPEVYSNQLTGRTVVSFRVSTLPGKIFHGTVSRAAGSLNMKYRSEAIEVDVKNDNGLLKPGMYAEVDMPVQRSGKTLVVPASAVVVSQERKYVIAVDGGKAHWVDVVTGNSRNDSTEVFGDLAPHARVIVNATDEIRDGSAVQ
ncbi:MAG TPA: efflux RND transporter periplasmic adaptor subunit [Puia sp.]|jgi:RND family efflux transporter MFP subunit|nr:efflux RND transporter periplasmic adaptor subunit [Puia sp.]